MLARSFLLIVLCSTSLSALQNNTFSKDNAQLNVDWRTLIGASPMPASLEFQDIIADYAQATDAIYKHFGVNENSVEALRIADTSIDFRFETSRFYKCLTEWNRKVAAAVKRIVEKRCSSSYDPYGTFSNNITLELVELLNTDYAEKR